MREIKRSFGGDAASLNMPAMPNIEACELMQLRKPRILLKPIHFVVVAQ